MNFIVIVLNQQMLIGQKEVERQGMVLEQLFDSILQLQMTQSEQGKQQQWQQKKIFEQQQQQHIEELWQQQQQQQQQQHQRSLCWLGKELKQQQKQQQEQQEQQQLQLTQIQQQGWKIEAIAAAASEKVE